MITLRRDVVLTEVEGETIVLDAARGNYWQLNPTAASILADLLNGEAEAEVAARTAADTGADQEQVLADLRALVEDLVQSRLVVREP